MTAVFANVGWTLRRRAATDTFCDSSYRWVLDATDGVDSHPCSFGFRKLEHLWNDWVYWAPLMHHRWRVLEAIRECLVRGVTSPGAVRAWLASTPLDLDRWVSGKSCVWGCAMGGFHPHRFGAYDVSDLDDDFQAAVLALLAGVEKAQLEGVVAPATSTHGCAPRRRL